MRVISTTDLSREGNDCYIYESVSLVEQFGIYIVLNFYKVIGWAQREEVNVLKYTSDRNEAEKAYKFFGGNLDEIV
jgi:hypothetical protein